MAGLNGWTTPMDWTAGAKVTEAQMDAQFRDNLAYLKLLERGGRTGAAVGDDCWIVPGVGTSPYLDGGVSAANAGTGAAVTAGTSLGAHPGLLTLATGTTSGGSVALIGPTDAIVTGTSDILGNICLAIPTLSTSGERFTTRVGLGDSATAESADFVGFRQVDNVSSGNWVLVCRNAATETTLDSATLPVAGTYVSLGFRVNAATTLATFYINGTSVGSISTNIPTSLRALTFLPCFLLKSVGSTSRTASVDSYSYLTPLAR